MVMDVPEIKKNLLFLGGLVPLSLSHRLQAHKKLKGGLLTAIRRY